MKLFTHIALALTLTNMVLLPVAQAQQAAGPSGADVVQRIERTLQDPAATARADAAITRDGTEILGAGNEPTSLASIVAGGTGTFTVVMPADERSNRFAVRVTRDLGVDQARMTYVLMNYATNPSLDAARALDRSAVTLRATDAPEEFQVAMQRMERRFAAAMSRETADNRGALQKAVSAMVNAVIPSAHANDAVARQLFAVTSTVAVCSLIGGLALMVGAIGLIKADVLTAARRTGAVGLMALGLAAGLGSLIGVSYLLTWFGDSEE